MENSKNKDDAGETALRGEALTGAERKRAADHVAYTKKHNTDTVLRTDGEPDTLYDDGLDVEDTTPPLVNTPGNDSTR